MRFLIPPHASGCRAARRIGGTGLAIPATVIRRRGQVAAFVEVCIDGTGPYPFLVDTGATTSEIDARLAARLGLPTDGRPIGFVGAGCETRARPRLARSWSLDGIPLQAQTLWSLPIPEFGGRDQPMGALGSDVWQRFGQLRIDFSRGQVVVPAGEQARPVAKLVARRPATSPLPRFLVRQPPSAEMPMGVEAVSRSVWIWVWVAFGSGRPTPLIPDTGATASAVAGPLVKSARLEGIDRRDTQSTFCSVIVVPRLKSGAWSLTTSAEVPASHQPLHPQVLDEAPTDSPKLLGVLGADQMSRFGSVVFDYAGGRLVLGAG